MKIVYIKLVNFADIYAAMGKREVSFAFDQIDKPIIQIYGRNRCGKTVLLQKLHPFSSINLNGDERNDVPLILKGETGIKNIVYEMNGKVYHITHMYKPTTTGHTVTSSMLCDGEELNGNGGVNTFNALVERLFHVNRYVFQFVINGTQLTSFANMNATQRKNLMNKAMGIDIYDKIHKLATDDYRYTSKLITSLNRTKEFLLSNYGSYETLRETLEKTRSQHDSLTSTMQQLKTRIDQLSGIIASLREQNLTVELTNLSQKITTYQTVVSEFGTYDVNMYEQLMEEQLRLNDDMNKMKSQRLLLMKDLDILYEKKTTAENERFTNQQTVTDYHNLLTMKQTLEQQIRDIQIEIETETPSSTFMSMLSIANAINDTCKEISICLNETHLTLFCNMLLQGIDVTAFLMKEGSVLQDSEKEKMAVSRIRYMLNLVEGEIVDDEDCRHPNCVYRNMYTTIQNYFNSYENITNGKFTQYDLEQFEHALKNYHTMKRLLQVEIPKELEMEFSIPEILCRLQSKLTGVDVEYIKRLMEEAAKMEMRKKYIMQLTSIDTNIENIKKVIETQNLPCEDVIPILQQEIGKLQQQISECEQSLSEYQTALTALDHKKVAISSIRNMDIHDIQARYTKLQTRQTQLTNAEREYQQLHEQYLTIQSQVQVIARNLETLENVDKQYITTIDEIEKHLVMDERYKIISEATSSTKGKPVIAIRDKITEALTMANRLLNVMYDGEIELLRPTIDETTFTLPFRCGTNTSADLRTGSQSESTLLSLALSLALAYCLVNDFIPLVDEIDAYIDAGMRDVFVLMLQEIMSTLKLEQMFLISHSIMPNQYAHIVHTIDISK